MKENKLIAEFMGLEVLYRPNSNGFIEISDTELCDVDDLEYHTSWDWLMPVIDKCYQEHMSKHIADAVMTCNIDKAHQEIVEFINQLNN